LVAVDASKLCQRWGTSGRRVEWEGSAIQTGAGVQS
jgi:hypothetical protein